MHPRTDAYVTTLIAKYASLRALELKLSEVQKYPEDPLGPAVERGLTFRRRALLDLEGADWQLVCEAEAALLLGVRDDEIEDRRQHNRLIGLNFGTINTYLYPRWQFVGENVVLPGLEEVLAALRDFLPFQQVEFFLEPLWGDGLMHSLEYLRKGGAAEDIINRLKHYRQAGGREG